MCMPPLPPPPPHYKWYNGLKVYGETEEDRQRVLAHLMCERPETNMNYVERHERVYKGLKADENEVRLSNEAMDQAMRLINFFCPPEPDIFSIFGTTQNNG